jgi:UPF0176 protein
MQSKLVVAALYCFVRLENIANIRHELLSLTKTLDIKGTLLLASEGVNGTVAGPRDSIDALMKRLSDLCDLSNIEYKESFSYDNPFLRMKIKLKKEIVTLGVEGVDPTLCVGEYISPQEWNDLIKDPEVLLIDTRNDYECEIGTFKGAVDPKTTTFRQFPEYVSDNISPHKYKKVAMFCTGGIRCEKASSFMLQQGFDTVYHLKGGILKYLEEIPAEESLWEGECFVFDERVSVKHGLELGSFDQCYGCRHPITEQDKQHSSYIKGVSCPRCVNLTTSVQKDRFSERQRQMDLAKNRGENHIGEVQDVI